MIEYKCNSCNRTIHLPENQNGLSHFGRCVITRNCRGQLFQIQNKPSVMRIAEPITRNDWIASSQLFNYEHTIPQNVWYFKHSMNCIPSITVYETELTETIEAIHINGTQSTRSIKKYTDYPIFDYEIDINETSCKVKFTDNKPRIGKVQCIARNPTEMYIEKDSNQEYIKISLNHLLTVAIHLHNSLLFIDPNSNTSSTTKLLIYLNNQISPFELVKSGSNAWVGTDNIQLHGNIFDLYTLQIITNPDIKNNYSSFAYTDELPAGYFLISKGTEQYDKDYDRFIDITTLTYDNNYIKDNDLYVHADLVKPCTPSILIL